MIFATLISAWLLLFNFNIQVPDTLSNKPGIQEQDDRYFILDQETLEFIAITKNTETVDSLLNLGIYMRDRDSRISFHVAREALTLSQELGYREGEAMANSLTASKYFDFGEFELALEHYISSLEIEDELGNEAEVANMFSSIGIVHLEQQNYDKAIEFLSQSIARWEKINQPDGAYTAINNLGVLYRRQGKYDKALELFYKAQEYAIEANADSLLYMIATLNIGNTHRNKGDLEKAPAYLNKAKKYFEDNNLRSGLTFSNLVLGQLHQDRQEFDLALEHALKSLEFAQQELQLQRIRDAYELIAEIYEDLGDYSQAYQNYRQFHQVSDSLLNLQRSERINEMQIRFDVEQKDREIDLLNKESALQEARIAQQVQLRNFMVAGLIMLTIFVALLIRNNRERKKRNELLRQNRQEITEQNEKLAELIKEKDDFLSIVAHDLRNPISIIVSIMSLMKHDENVTREEIDEYSEMILISSDKMLQLINDLLDIQSISHGKIQDIKEKVNIHDPLQQSVDDFIKTAKIKDIEIYPVFSEHAGIIAGNRQKLARVFDNLISNAIKYSPHGSEVFVSTHVQEGRVLVSFRDKGEGISRDDQKKLFGKFSRLANKPTGNETSTGLGLFIVKKLVNSMNGKVWCESTPGEGAVFYLEFPILNGVEEYESKEETITQKIK